MRDKSVGSRSIMRRVFVVIVGSASLFHSIVHAGTSPIVASYAEPGMERSSTTAADSSGNLYITGNIGGFFGVLKYDSQGAFLWAYRTIAKGAGNSLAFDNSGNIIVAGYTINATGQAEWLNVKLSSQGAAVWSRAVGVGRGQSVAVDPSGGIYIGGALYSPNAAPWTMIRLNSDGTLHWQRVIATGSNDQFDGLACDQAGNVIAMGRIVRAEANAIDMVTLKMNSQGATLWQVTNGQPDHLQFPHAIAIDSSGNAWLTGEVASMNNDALVPPFTVAYDADGKLIRSLSEGGAALALDPQGGILISDTLEAATLSDRRPSVAKFDPQGAKVWERILTGTETESSAIGSRIAIDDAASVYVASTIDTVSSNSYDYLISKIDMNGVVQWQHRFNGMAGMNDTVTALNVDVFGNAVATGSSYISCSSSSTGSCESINSLFFARGVVPSATSSLPISQPTSTPAPPSNLIASAFSNSVTLQWRDNASNESGFRIERCTGGGCSNFLQIGEVSANANKFSNNGLSPNTTYVYRVRAFNSGGDSNYSNSVAVKTPKR